MELAARQAADPIRGSLSMQRNKVHHVQTVGLVATQLGVDEDLIHDLTRGLEPEDGVIWVYGLDDETLAFTDQGVDEVRLLIAQYNRLKPPKC